MKTYFDYENQAWVRDGVYVRCNHPGDCRECYGSTHEGEVPIDEIRAEYDPTYDGGEVTLTEEERWTAVAGLGYAADSMAEAAEEIEGDPRLANAVRMFKESAEKFATLAEIIEHR